MQVIKVENISKKYRLGVYGGKTLSEDISAWLARVRGKENPLITIGDEKRANEKGEFWALRDISFSLSQGDVLGIVGRNGAGKSTLLKLLSRITAPTSGGIKIKGRIAALLEVGTGFHVELTGRENIFLNGAILGMSKVEITSKLDEIIFFSGIEHHIDTPVKRYSSGMKVRLGFAVAAHLEPEILIIDEVLAVGDVEFQRKCIGKMQDVAGKGRTILFVSHNMASVKALCNKALMLDEGKVVAEGEVDDIVTSYISTNLKIDPINEVISIGSRTDRGVQLMSAGIASSDSYLTMDSKFAIWVKYSIEKILENFHIIFHVINEEGIIVFGSGFFEQDRTMSYHEPGVYKAQCAIPPNLMNAGFYSVRFVLVNEGKIISKTDGVISFQIEEGKLEGRGKFNKRAGVIRPKLEWKKEKVIQ